MVYAKTSAENAIVEMETSKMFHQEQNSMLQKSLSDVTTAKAIADKLIQDLQGTQYDHLSA